MMILKSEMMKSSNKNEKLLFNIRSAIVLVSKSVCLLRFLLSLLCNAVYSCPFQFNYVMNLKKLKMTRKKRPYACNLTYDDNYLYNESLRVLK